MSEDTTTETETVEETETVVEDKPTGDAPSGDELKQLRAALKKANSQAAASRKEADDLRKKTESESEAAVRTAKEQAAAEVEGTWRPRAVRLAARAALIEAGLIGKPDRILRLIEVDQVEVDDDGEVTGLEAQIRELKKEYPDLFGKRGAARIDGADRGNGSGTRTKDQETSKRLFQSIGLA